MNFNIVKATFTLHWPDGRTKEVSQSMFDHDVEWVAQQYIEVNGLTKVVCEFNGESFEVTP